MIPSALSARQVPGLTGLRGIAILLVLVLHFFKLAPQTPVEQFLFKVFEIGWIGVDLFFVLSGALITGILLDSRGQPHYFSHFYLKRVLRIFPLYYLLLILSFYVLPYVPFEKIAAYSTADVNEAWYWLFLSNFGVAASYGDPAAHHNIMDITWSLAIEEQFYLFWPLLVCLISMRKLAVLSVALLVFSFGLRLVMQAQGYEAYTLYAVTPTRFDGLAAGALVAIALRWPGLSADTLRRWALALCAAGAAGTAAVAIASGGLPWDGAIVHAYGFSTLACFFAGVVLLAYVTDGSGSRFQQAISSRFLVAFGVLAFGIYLLHLPVRALLMEAVLSPEGFAAWPGGPIAGQMAFMAFGVAGSYAVGWVSYHAFEKQFQRFRPRKNTPSADFLLDPAADVPGDGRPTVPKSGIVRERPADA